VTRLIRTVFFAALIIAAAGTVISTHGTPATIAASRCEITHRNHQPGPDVADPCTATSSTLTNGRPSVDWHHRRPGLTRTTPSGLPPGLP
jgi:hypothetical protein